MNPINPFTILSLIVVIGWVLTAVLLKRKYNTEEVEIKFQPFWFLIFIVLFLFLVISSFSAYLGIGAFSGFVTQSVNIFEYLGIILGIILVTISIGKRLQIFITRRINSEPPDILEDLIFSFGYGVVCIVISMFILGLFGLIKIEFVLTLLLLFTFISYKEVKFWIKEFFIKNIKVNLNLNLLNPVPYLFAVLLLVITANFVNLMRPIPNGFDEITRYLNTSSLVSQTGGLLYGINSYFWEIYASIGFVVFKSVAITRMITGVVGYFVIVAIYYLTKLYCKKREIETRVWPLLVAVMFYALPMIMFQSSIDLKVDIASTYFMVMGLISFIKWHDSRKNNYLYQMALWLGIAFTIKYTSIFITVGLFCYILFYFIKTRTKFKEIVATSFIATMIFVTPFIPFALWNMQSMRLTSVFPMLYGSNPSWSEMGENFREYYKQIEKPEFMIAKSLYKELEKTNRYEMTRYKGSEGNEWLRFLKAPFVITNNTSIYSDGVDIGFVFLAFVPLVGLYYFQIKKRKKKNIQLLKALMAIATIGYLIWFIGGSGIVWYAMPIIPLLLILIIELINYVKTGKRLIYFMILGVLTIWLALTLILKLSINNYDDISSTIKYSRGQINKDDFIQLVYSKERIDAWETINKNTKSNEPRKRVLLLDKFITFYIDKNDNIASIDNLFQLNIFNYDRNTENTNSRLKENGFKYIVYKADGVYALRDATVIEDAKQLFFNLIKDKDRFKILFENQKEEFYLVEIL